MKNMGKVMLAGLVLAATVVACTKNADNYTPDCGGTTKSFATDVNPVIQSYCATNSGCHATGSHQGPGALTTYAQVYNARTSIRSSIATGSMPQGASLTNAQKNIIICWIDNGAANN